MKIVEIEQLANNLKNKHAQLYPYKYTYIERKDTKYSTNYFNVSININNKRS